MKNQVFVFFVVLVSLITACDEAIILSTPTPAVDETEIVLEPTTIVVTATPYIDKPFVSEVAISDNVVVVTGHNFRPTNVIYLNGGYGSLATDFISATQLQARLPELMGDCVMASCELSLTVISGGHEETSGVVFFSYIPGENESTANSVDTVGVTDSLVVSVTSRADEGVSAPNSEHTAVVVNQAPILCAPISNVPTWYWLEPGTLVEVLATPHNEEKYDASYLLVRDLSHLEVEGWIAVDNLEFDIQLQQNLPSQGENNRCYGLTADQIAMQTTHRFWVVTNPDTGVVNFHCAPNGNSGLWAHLQENFVLVEKRQGSWLYGMAWNIDGQNIYGWLRLSDIVPRPALITVEEVPLGEEITNC